MKATEQYFSVVLFILMYKMFFWSVDESLIHYTPLFLILTISNEVLTSTFPVLVSVELTILLAANHLMPDLV